MIRLIYVFITSDDIFMRHLIIDAAFYDEWGQAIASGDLIGSTVFHQDPLYAYFLGAIYWLFGHHTLLIRIIQCFLDTGTIALLYFMGKSVSDHRGGLLSAAMGAFYGPMVYYTGLLDKTSFSSFLIAASLASLLVINGKGSRKGYFFSGVILGLAALTRGNLIVLVMGIIPWLLFKKWKLPDTETALSAFAYTAGVLVVIGTVTIRNYCVARDFVPITTNAGLNFFIGNNPYTAGMYIQPIFLRGIPQFEYLDSKSYAERVIGKSLPKPSLVSKFYFSQGFQFIHKHPQEWIQLTYKKFRLAFHNFEVHETYSFKYFQDKYRWLVAAPLHFGIVAPIGLLGLIIAAGRPTPVSIFFVSYLLTLLAFFVTSRYRLPLAIPLIPMAGRFLSVELPTAIGANKKRCFLLVLSLAALLGFCNSTPEWMASRVIADEAATSYILAGNIYLKQGNIQSAIAEFNLAREKTPQSFYSYLYLSECYYRMGQKDREIEALETVIKLNPLVDVAYARLGLAYIEKKDYSKALAALSRALELKPQEPAYQQNYHWLVGQLRKHSPMSGPK